MRGLDNHKRVTSALRAVKRKDWKGNPGQFAYYSVLVDRLRGCGIVQECDWCKLCIQAHPGCLEVFEINGERFVSLPGVTDKRDSNFQVDGQAYQMHMRKGIKKRLHQQRAEVEKYRP